MYRHFRRLVFADSWEVDPTPAYSEAERAALARLREPTATLFALCIAVYHGDEFVGWSFGQQETAERFCMVNTGLLRSHRGHGVYTSLLPVILQLAEAEGFQTVPSRHVASNNAVLVPKLKAGFVITGLELTDTFGLMVVLSYYFNPVRRAVLDVRAGLARPDETVLRTLPRERESSPPLAPTAVPRAPGDTHDPDK